MSDIKNLTRKEAEEKLQTRQADLAKVFEAARTDDGYDYSKAVSVVSGASDAIAVAEHVKALNAEADELAKHVETFREADKAAADFAARGKARPGFVHPGQGQGGQPANRNQFKSIGEQLVNSPEFKEWYGQRSPQGATVQFGDMLPSEFLAKAAAFETMGSKALMATTSGFAPESIRLPGFVEAVTRPIQLLDILPMGNVSQAAVPYMEETTRTHAAAEAAEGAAFAESTFVFTQRSISVVKITDSLPVTDEQLEDVALIESYANSRLAYGVRQRLDGQAMTGNGTAPNMRGILNTVGIQTLARGTDPQMDALYKAMVRIRTIGRALPTHHVIHPLDWQDIRLTRTADGIYIFGSPMESGPERLWGLPVVQNEAIAENTSLVGSFEPSWITLFERRGIDIQVGYTGSQFTQGIRTMRADMRAALVLFRPAAFHTVTGM
ncbi:phage major capsid protein [Erythrobacter sp. WG]|uniref:phage major capsid protein n=1 Tax=Erythrobacter sp. WG TaxID=2985510 RepID=UPI002270683B|nr:phage major capsid protein [Erythrobacter sp. WG]MCX9146612.1 phage major capsid protein [Erythrobacter sp. WG]